MPDLKCTVQTCVHNYKFLCDLDKIQVGGDTAKTAQETCCDSFQERKEGSYMNAAFQTGLLLIFVVLTVRQQNVCIMRIDVSARKDQCGRQ